MGNEAERVIRKVGESAEPMARQFATEVNKLGKKISESVAEATGRSSRPPAPETTSDE